MKLFQKFKIGSIVTVNDEIIGVQSRLLPGQLATITEIKTSLATKRYRLHRNNGSWWVVEWALRWPEKTT
jgi:hypothetical protein